MILILATLLLNGPDTIQDSRDIDASVARQVENLVRQISLEVEDVLVDAGTTEPQRRYFYCHSLVPRSRFISERMMAAEPRELFPELVEAVEEQLSASEASRQLSELPGSPELYRLIDELALDAAPTGFDAEACQGSLIPSAAAYQRSADEVARCAAYLSTGLTPRDEPQMLQCSYANLLQTPIRQ